jgi:hypothetical protein
MARTNGRAACTQVTVRIGDVGSWRGIDDARLELKETANLGGLKRVMVAMAARLCVMTARYHCPRAVSKGKAA